MTLSVRLLLLLPWMALVALALVAAGLVLKRSSGAWRWGSLLQNSGSAATATALLWGLLRLARVLGASPGPLDWPAHPAGTSSDPGELIKRACLLGLGAGGVFAVWLVGCSLWRTRRGTQSPPIMTLAPPLARLSAVVAVGAGLFSMLILAADPVVLEPLLDLVAVAPVIACGLALSMLAAPNDTPLLVRPQDQSNKAAAQPGIASAIDISASGAVAPEALLRRQGRLRAAEPDFQVQRTSAPVRPAAGGPSAPRVAPLDRLWSSAGGSGPAPQVVHRIGERLDSPGAGILLGDLPEQTECALVDTLAALTVTVRAGRALVICPGPEPLTARVRDLLTRLGIALPGPMPSRLGALQDALSRGELPVLVCLAPAEVSSRAIQALGTGSEPWLAAVDLVLLVHPDRFFPIEATHLAFTLRRLALAFSQHRRAPQWVALGEGTPGVKRLLAHSLAHPFEQLPLGALATADVRVFIRRSAAHAGAELNQCATALEAARLDVHIEDPSGELESAAADGVADSKRWHHEPGYNGACALALLDERHLASLFRMRQNLAHQVAGSTHLGCWWVKESPLSRFLTERGTLTALEKQGELPSPRPVVGLHNRYLAVAHLEAALHEGRPDQAGLHKWFGEAVVAQLLGTQQNIRTEGTRAVWDAHARSISRSPILTRPATPWPDQRRETVTQNLVRIRSEKDGAVLRHVDRRVAATRYYPHRAFASRGTLYRVGQDALLPTGSDILVNPAAAGALPTHPLLELELSHTERLRDMETHSFQKIRFALGISALSIRESVSGAIPDGSATAHVRYAPVHSEYDTVAAVLAFEQVPSAMALRHVGRLIDMILPAHLLAEPDDIEVMAYSEGLGELRRPLLVFVDRNLDGIGAAEALDAGTMHDLLRWAWGILYSCPCMDGCPACTPRSILHSGSDKQRALKLLGG